MPPSLPQVGRLLVLGLFAAASVASLSSDSDGAILCELYSGLTGGTQSLLPGWCGPRFANGSFVNGPCSSSPAHLWTGIGCATVGGTQRVVSLNIDNLRVVGGSLPTSIGGLAALTLLDVGVNSLKGEIPSTLGLLTRLVHLDLSDNSFSSQQLPSQIYGLRALTYLNLFGSLNLQRNTFSSTIPTALGTLSQLTFLSIGQNSFVGPLLTFTKLTQLAYLEMTSMSNQMVIPSNWWDEFVPAHAAQLEMLYLGGTSMKGATLPSSTAAMSRLNYLDLTSVGMGGSVPTVLGSLTGLRYLHLGFNLLTGSVPASYCDLMKGVADFRALDLSNNPGLTCYASCMSSVLNGAWLHDASLMPCPGPPSPQPINPTLWPTPQPSNPSQHPTPGPTNPSFSPTPQPTLQRWPTPLPTLSLLAPSTTTTPRHRSGWASFVQFLDATCQESSAGAVESFALGACVPFIETTSIGRRLWDVNAASSLVSTSSPTSINSRGTAMPTPVSGPCYWNGNCEPTSAPTLAPSWAVSIATKASDGSTAITTKLYADNQCQRPSVDQSGAGTFSDLGEYQDLGSGSCVVAPPINWNQSLPRGIQQFPRSYATYTGNNANGLPGSAHAPQDSLLLMSLSTRDPKCADESLVYSIGSVTMSLLCSEPSWDPISHKATSVIGANTVSYTVGCASVGTPQVLKFEKGNCDGRSTVVPISQSPPNIQKIIQSAALPCNPLKAEGMLAGYSLLRLCVAQTAGGWDSSGADGGESSGAASSATAATAVNVSVGVGVALFVLLVAAGGAWYYYYYRRPVSLASLQEPATQPQHRPSHRDDIPNPVAASRLSRSQQPGTGTGAPPGRSAASGTVDEGSEL